MSTVAIIQARMGSRRFPGKVMVDILGKPMLQRVVERVKKAKLPDDVILAVPKDDIIFKKITKNIWVYGGSEVDVLDRYYGAANWAYADTIVRITGDCPLIDPEVIDGMISYFKEQGDLDYLYNTNDIIKSPYNYPDGLDVEILSFSTLKRVWQEANSPLDREHVTRYILNHINEFKLENFPYHRELPDYRWSVNVEKNLEFVRRVYSELGEDFHLEDILRMIEEDNNA